MRLVRRGVYRCTICDDIIFVFAANDEVPVATFVDAGRNRSERVVTVSDIEVHRCVVPTPATSDGVLGTPEPAY